MSSISLNSSSRFTFLATAITTIVFSGYTTAEEAKENKIERIEVTGSRIKQVDMETASPVTVITAADLKVTGETSVADVLNNSSINSFGSWRGMSGYGAGASATSDVNLRGLGSQATLVLLDGRRMPGTSSSSGTVADTSSIPMAIVERIEILRDGASAVYGSDAVAGVINIITKKDFEGVELNYTGELPDVEGGDSSRFSIAAGYSTDKGNITLTFEHYDTTSVYDRHVWDEGGADWFLNNGSPYSSSPNGYYNTGKLNDNGSEIYSFFYNPATCTQAGATQEAASRCLYDPGSVTKLFGNVNRNSILSNFNYRLTNDIQFRGRASASLSETNTRYAGTPVSTNLPVMAADNVMNPLDKELSLYMRATQIGPRDTTDETNAIDFLAGLVGYWDVGHGIDWEINAQHTRSTTDSFSYNLINDNIVQDLINTGDYDIFNTTGMSYEDWDAQMTDLYRQAAHTGVYQAQFNSTQFDGFMSGMLYDGNGITLAAVVGAEYEMIEFVQLSDPQSAAGIISGGSGGDDVDATRDRSAGYIELQSSLPYNVDLSAALRYERYEQEGNIASGHVSSTFDSVVPKFSASWRPVDTLLLRASWGESFRAPNMGEMFSGEAMSFNYALDSLWCADNSDENYCANNQQHKTLFGGNPNLEAEEGESLTLGFVWDITDNWSIETSYYDISYDNKIEVVGVNDLIREEIANGGSQYIIRGSDGKIETIHSHYRNLSALETSGIDFVTSYNQETDFGDFRLKLEMTHVLEYKTKADAESDFFDEAGLQDLPQWRGSASINWSRDNWSAAWTAYYIGSQDSGADIYQNEDLIDVSSYFKHNVQVTYAHDWNGSITLGVNNLFDEEAPTWYSYDGYRDTNTNLYDVLGRTWFVTINQKF